MHKITLGALTALLLFCSRSRGQDWPQPDLRRSLDYLYSRIVPIQTNNTLGTLSGYATTNTLQVGGLSATGDVTAGSSSLTNSVQYEDLSGYVQTNDTHYLAALTNETQTLQDVTDNGAITTNKIEAAGFIGDGSQLTNVEGLPDGTGTNQFVMYDSNDWVVVGSVLLAQEASPQQLRDPFTTSVGIPVVAGTATVTRALGNELYLELTGNTTLAYSTNDFPLTGAMTWSLGVNRGTHVLSLDTNLFDTTTFDALDIDSNTWYRVIGSKGYGQTLGEVY